MSRIAANAGRWSPARAGLVALAALPFVASISAHALGSAPTIPAEGPERPALIFEYHLIDQGLLPPGSTAAARFRFRNVGDHPVTITGLKPSCGCLQPRLEQREYRPGEFGHFDVQVRTVNEPPGPHEYTIAVQYTDPLPHEVQLAFRAVFPEDQIRVEPPALLIYQTGNSITEHEIAVTDYRPSPARIVRVETSRPWLSAEALPAQATDGQQVTRVVVRLSEEIPPGRQEGVVRIHTDDERYTELKVPVFVQTVDQLPVPASGPTE